MSLTGKPLVIALVSTALLGVAAGSFAAGWRKAQGLPELLQCDAGVQLQLDAGVSEQQHCAAAIEHWTTVTVPVPYVLDAGPGVSQMPTVQTVTILVPDVRLRSDQSFQGSLQEEASASVTATAKMEPMAKETHWELGPVGLYNLKGHDALVGVGAGWSAGPFGVRALAAGNQAEVVVGVGVVWRF